MSIETRRTMVIGGRPAVCWTGIATTPGLIQIPGMYRAWCLVDRRDQALRSATRSSSACRST
jgi:hypothetical protein